MIDAHEGSFVMCLRVCRAGTLLWSMQLEIPNIQVATYFQFGKGSFANVNWIVRRTVHTV
eukprot:scaffold293682_cov39-Prasinocladus_malaysianus.AAC.2